MTPHDIIRSALERVMDIHHADEMAEEILARIAAQGFVVVPVEAVIRMEGQANG